MGFSIGFGPSQFPWVMFGFEMFMAF